DAGGGAAKRGDVRVHAFTISLREILRRYVDRLLRLHIFEHDGLVERRRKLFGVEQLKNHHVVSVIRERLHGPGHDFWIAVKIRDDGDEAATREVFVELLERRLEIGLPTGLHVLECMKEADETALPARGRTVVPQFFIEHEQPDGIVLARREVAE